ncbi:MAG: 3,4-dihydroxy-2-butanone-4-phosphate synthase [Acidobacteria bacterium]|nr:3,4-dihydroxy-2-butanone-4-phosphate synthase [Acidobacteriota bacterium]
MKLSKIEDALTDYRQGKFVIIIDDEDRENEGDLALAAQFTTPQKVHFMAREGRGLICVSVTRERTEQLGLPMMVDPAENSARFATPFTVSVDAARGVTTGISAFDRATTIHTLVDRQAKPQDLVRPGHVFPLRAADRGVLERRGQTEASLDMARLAGLYPAGVICEILAESGEMARGAELDAFADRFGLKIVSIADLVAHRKGAEGRAVRGTECRLPTSFGEFRARVYEDTSTGLEHVALWLGDPTAAGTLVRLHSECLTGDALGSRRCDCREQLQDAQRHIASEGAGILLYLRQEGRGIGLREKLRAYALQDTGLDTVEANHRLGHPADARTYETAAWILRDLGCRSVRLLTNNPAKIKGLEQHGVEVIERRPLLPRESPENQSYLATKRDRLGHFLPDSNQQPAATGWSEEEG